jgi:hypothetical protein
MPAADGCNTCFCSDGEWACTEMACLPPEGDDPNADAGDSGASGKVTGAEIMRIFLGALALLAGAFLLTLIIRGKRQEEDY